LSQSFVRPERAEALADDAFESHGAGMPKYDFAGMCEVLIKLQAGVRGIAHL
jgi:hypothetical protein